MLCRRQGRKMKQTKKATLADIAAQTGYGTNTVSLALRGSTRISQGARDLIQSKARELDYVPNANAKALVLQRSHTVGLLLPEITNPIMTSVSQVVQSEFAKRGYSVLFAMSNGSIEEENRAIDMFRSRMVDGLLVYPLDHGQLDYLSMLRQRNFPVMLLIGKEESDIDAVGIDEFRGAYDATKYLIDLGHTNIGALVNHNQRNTEKYCGFQAAMQENGLTMRNEWIRQPDEHTLSSGRETTGLIMQAGMNRPSAIFASSDLLGLGALRWAKDNNLRVPEDLSIVGFDDIEGARHSLIGLTTIRNDVTYLARLAVERLVALIGTNGPLPKPEVKLLRGELMLRESAAAYTPSTKT
jgi:LacI family transcriptional regulator